MLIGRRAARCKGAWPVAKLDKFKVASYSAILLVPGQYHADTLSQESVCVLFAGNELSLVLHWYVAEISRHGLIGLFHKFIHDIKPNIFLWYLIQKLDRTVIMIAHRNVTSIVSEIMFGHRLDHGIGFFSLDLKQCSVHFFLNLEHLIHTISFIGQLQMISVRNSNKNYEWNYEETKSTKFSDEGLTKV